MPGHAARYSDEQIFRAVQDARTQVAAARILGLSQTHVSAVYRRYSIAHELPVAKQNGAALREAQARLEETRLAIAYEQGRAAALRDMTEQLDRMEALAGRVMAFEKRLPNIIRQALISAAIETKEVRLPIPSTRRIINGGDHGSAEWKRRTNDHE